MEFSFWKRLIHECTMTWIWKSNTIFRETTMIFYSREHGKHNFYFFWFLKFVMQYCIDYNVGKTWKNMKIKQIHPNWRQNRLIEKWENSWNSLEMEDCIEFLPLKSQSKKMRFSSKNSKPKQMHPKWRQNE